MKLIVFGVILWCSLFGNYLWAQKVDTTKVYNIDEVVVAVAASVKKKPLFDQQKRVELAKEAVKCLPKCFGN